MRSCSPSTSRRAVSAQEDLAGGPALPDLCSALLASLSEKQTQALLVHRLDRGTTGVTVLAGARRRSRRCSRNSASGGAQGVSRALGGLAGGRRGAIDTAIDGETSQHALARARAGSGMRR